MDLHRFGFRIVGSCWEERRPVDWPAAFSGYRQCDERAQVDREAYLSAFTFGTDFRRQLDETGSVREFDGLCWSPWLWFDIDREGDIERARREAVRLAMHLEERYRLTDGALLVFFSGSKGFHVGLPTSLFGPEAARIFNKTARRFAEDCAGRCAVGIDAGVYDKVRAFRAPNSRHPKTGMYKRRLMLEEVLHLSADAVLGLAAEPESFEPPQDVEENAEAVADWQNARASVEREMKAVAERRAASNGKPTLNRRTLEFIRNGAGEGDRHRLLYSAARNLLEFGCPSELAHALLSESALDSGLPPKDVRRQIERGLRGDANLETDAP